MLIRTASQTAKRSCRTFFATKRFVTDGKAALKSLNDDVNALAALHRDYSQNDEYLRGCTNASHLLAQTASMENKGNVFATGVGKAGVVAQRMSIALSSISVPARWVHGTEWVHGDLGALREGDCVFAISNSGQTQEILDLAHLLPDRGVKLISVVGDIHSPVCLVWISDQCAFEFVARLIVSHSCSLPFFRCTISFHFLARYLCT